MKTQRRSTLVFLVAICLLGLATVVPHGSLEAEVTKPAPPKAFLSGAERSEIVLREMSETLKSIDARLARLEKTAERAANAVSAPGEQERRP